MLSPFSCLSSDDNDRPFRPQRHARHAEMACPVPERLKSVPAGHAPCPSARRPCPQGMPRAAGVFVRAPTLLETQFCYTREPCYECVPGTVDR